MLTDTWTPRARSRVEGRVMSHAVSVDTPLGPNAFVLSNMSGRETLSMTFEYALDLFSEDPNLPLHGLLGQPFAVHLDLSGGELRHFHGHVASARLVQRRRDPLQHSPV